MMLSGHTHEDIDAMFRFIADSLRAKGLVRTIDEFVDATHHAFKDQRIHVQHVKVVPDWSTWLKESNGDYDQIKTARYYVVRKRESDGRPVMWYKPCVAHEHLYPVLKDAESGMPLSKVVDGETVYETDMEGIEVFSQLPEGTPKAQAFESDRLNVDDIHETMKEIFTAHPFLFGQESRDWWMEWAAKTCNDVEDVLSEEPLSFDWPAQCEHWEAPTRLASLRSEYAETITYINTHGQQAFRPRDAAQAMLEENKGSPALNKGDLILLKPGADDGMHRLPFWVAEAGADVSENVTTIPVVWRSAFKRSIAVDDVDASWLHMCTANIEGRGGCVRYHPYHVKTCTVRGMDKRSHGLMMGSVERSAVAIYFPKLTAKSAHM